MNIKYCFREPRMFGRLDPESAATELARVHDENGVLTPDAVLDVARDPGNPLHPAFEWNDSRAAENWRRRQATDLIYSVRIIREEAKPEPVYIHSESSGGYKTAEEVVSRVDLFDEARKKAYARIGEAEASLRQLEEIAGRHRPDSSRAINKIANAMNQAQRALHAV
jgi:hypothetical protein